MSFPGPRLAEKVGSPPPPCANSPKACIAALRLGCHFLEVYTLDALNAVLGQLLVATHVDLPSVPSEPALVDGFTAEQWAAYARKKSAIASKKCKENGFLKAQLVDASKASPALNDHVDRVHLHDPWSGTKLTSVASSVGDRCSNHDAWSSWNPPDMANSKLSAKPNAASPPLKDNCGIEGSTATNKEANEVTLESVLETGDEASEQNLSSTLNGTCQEETQTQVSSTIDAAEREVPNAIEPDDLSPFHPHGRKPPPGWKEKLVEHQLVWITPAGSAMGFCPIS